MNGLALFAGIGGIELGLKLAVSDYRTICYVENDAYCVEVLKARIRDRCLDDAPIWDDVRTFDGIPWCGLVDIISGGFPCQDVSVAGKRIGIKGERSGLWIEFNRIVREVEPRFVLVENVPGLRYKKGGFFGRVLGDLAESGYNARWESITAASCGAPHRRDRVFIFAYPRESTKRVESRRRDRANRATQGQPCDDGKSWNVANANGQSSQRPTEPRQERNPWAVEPDVGRVADGIPHRVDRLKALGNAVVPAVVVKFLREVIQCT